MAVVEDVLHVGADEHAAAAALDHRDDASREGEILKGYLIEEDLVRPSSAKNSSKGKIIASCESHSLFEGLDHN